MHMTIFSLGKPQLGIQENVLTFIGVFDIQIIFTNDY